MPWQRISSKYWHSMAQSKKNLTPWLVLGGILLASQVVAAFIPAPGPGDNDIGDEIDQDPTLTRERMAQLADAIYTALLQDPWTEDEQAAIAAIVQCNNDADVAGLISVFGVRSEGWYAPNYTLPGAITEYLNADQRADLNAQLARKGITFMF